MKTKTIRERVQIVQIQGIDKPEKILGYIWIERYFKLDEYGFPYCSNNLPHDKLLSVMVGDARYEINIPFTNTALEEFFPGFNGYEAIEEIEMDSNPWRKP